MDQRLACSLYRRALRLVTYAQQNRLERVAETRWVEYLPRKVVLQSHESLPVVLRRCFDQPATSNSLRTAFDFLKDATDSLFDLELLALWDEVASCGGYDLYDGIGLISAALQLATAGPVRSGVLRRCWRDHCTFLHGIIADCAKGVESRVSSSPATASSTAQINEMVQLVREVMPLTRREAKAEDHSALSVKTERCASEYLLNLLLFLLLEEVKTGGTNALVGDGLAFRWIRVTPSSDRPLILSWSFGAMSQKEARALVHSADTQCFRSSSPAAYNRKAALCGLLKQQLTLLSNDTTVAGKRQCSVCKTQLLHLLS